MERDLLGKATLPDLLINWPLSAARESRATILEWRAATGPIGPMGDHNELAGWQYQTAMCSQTFEDLPDQLEELIIRPVVGRITSSQKRAIYCCGRSSTIIPFTSESGMERVNLTRAWSYIKRHGNEFHDEAQLVHFLGDNLEMEASEWFTHLMMRALLK
ncbi:hypothetical protein E2320_003492 [Naja naja]|nr:hypothetical protein E2320_003492 [Naja naja]